MSFGKQKGTFDTKADHRRAVYVLPVPHKGIFCSGWDHGVFGLRHPTAGINTFEVKIIGEIIFLQEMQLAFYIGLRELCILRIFTYFIIF